MGEIVVQATTVLKGMWRFRWIGLIAAWIAGIVGVAMALRVPNQFEASARIYVDTQSILKPLMSGLAIQPNIDQQIAMLSRTLISRPNVEKLVRMADLDLRSTSKADQDAQVESLMRTLQIWGNGRDNLYTLAFRDQEPERAKRVVQSLVSIFIDSRLSASRNDADQAKVFLNEQIKAYEAKLEAAEARLKEFRLRNIDLFTAEGQDSAARIGDIGAQLAQAQLELREAEQARDAARQQLAAERQGTASTAMQSLLQESALTVSTPEIDARIDGQRRQLDTLLQRFTDQHPDVINTRRLIRDLEEQKKKEVAELRKQAAATGTGGQGSGSAAAQELTRMMAAAEVQVAALRARVGEYQARYARAKESMKTAPQLEAEAAQLNRDYAINKRNYEDLVSRRQSATMSGDLDAAAGLADFRLIDPPRVTPKPVYPNRGALLGMALAAALGAGLFVAFAASQLRPAFHKASELREKINLPILGVVSMILSDADRRRERADKLRFGVASGALVGAFLVVLVATTIVPKS
ncbi:chain length-determining protein [Schlegelella sp. ID0723]|uniref:Chain length-determining protein n=2 Tax=Piscinibacter koreensis TaxID=2742824 RepID=A0A7Y6TVH8_9BURK|nr:chain length-determining protein [Schlegelella koreensis]